MEKITMFPSELLRHPQEEELIKQVRPPLIGDIILGISWQINEKPLWVGMYDDVIYDNLCNHQCSKLPVVDDCSHWIWLCKWYNYNW